MSYAYPRYLFSRYGASIFCLLAFSFLAGCSIGPTVLKGNRLGYNQHLHSSNKEELLINIVRMRYGEQPLFLQVGAITANFGQGVNAGMSSTFQKGGGIPSVSINAPSVGYSYSESPTIVYTPVQGAEYASRMLSEIDLPTFLLMVRGNWSLRTLCRFMIMRIGQLYNPVPNGPKSYGLPDNDAMFSELINFFWKLETRGDIEFVGMEEGRNKVGQALVRIRFADAGEAKRFGELVGSELPLETLSSGSLVTTLKLNPVNDFTEREAGEIYFRLRNFQEVLWAVSLGIEDDGDTAAQMETSKFRTPADGIPYLLMAVHTSKNKPMNASVSVFERDKWYYIADDDLYSKFCLSMLGSLYSLQANPPQGPQPFLTLPVAR